MGRLRIKFRMSRKQKLIFEVGVAILCMIIFLGVLGAIKQVSYVPILTTEDLWQNTNVTTIVFQYSNSTAEKSLIYNLSDVATYSNGRLYISIPSPPSDIPNASLKSITINMYNLNITWNDLIEKGLNRIELFLYIHNTTDFGLNNNAIIGLGRVNSPNQYVVWIDDKKYVGGFRVFALVFYDKWDVFYEKYMGLGSLDNTTVITADIDPGLLALNVVQDNAGNAGVGLMIGGHKGQKFLADYMVIDLKLYAVSEKPVLKVLSEPLYSFFAGLWSAMLGLWRRVQSVVASAFGGFSLSAVFTGLIGDPIVALILSIFIITVFFMIMRPRR